MNNLALADRLAVCRGGESHMVPEVGLFGVSRPGVAAIDLTGVEANLAGVPSEAPNLSAYLPLFSCTWDSCSMPPETEPRNVFLLNGDATVDGLLVLVVAGQVEDL